MRIPTDKKSSPKSGLKSIFSLSSGTFIVQSLSAAGQFFLALWLVPSEFGYWAAAVSAMTILTALTNFGEINGYLSGANLSFRKARSNAFGANLVLSAGGLAISAFYFYDENYAVGLYCLIIALTIPLHGEADLRTAACIRYKRFSKIIAAQTVAAILKFLISVIIAASTQSALSLAVSNTIYYLVIILILHASTKFAFREESEVTQENIPFKKRVPWAINSYFMIFPVQVIFLVSQFLLTPEQLGLLYIGFQITLALSGLLAVPLNRVALSTLSNTSVELRGKFVAELSFAISFIVTVASVLLGLFLTSFMQWLPSAWVPAIPIAVAFLISMPMRILTPLIEARQQVEKKWSQGAIFNVLESAGSVVVILSFSSTENILYLALAISGWKIVFGIFRSIYVLRTERFWISTGPTFAGSIGALALLGCLVWPVLFNVVFLIVSIPGIVVLRMLRKRSSRKESIKVRHRSSKK